MTLEEATSYILILREEEFGNNYKLSEAQVNLIKKVNELIKQDPQLKTKLDMMLLSRNNEEIKNIWYGVNNTMLPIKEDNSIEENVIEDIIDDDIPNSSDEKGKQKVKTSGFVDVLVMSLVTGFIGGISMVVLLMLIK